jgi:hypothetical protein
LSFGWKERGRSEKCFFPTKTENPQRASSRYHAINLRRERRRGEAAVSDAAASVAAVER